MPTDMGISAMDQCETGYCQMCSQYTPLFFTTSPWLAGTLFLAHSLKHQNQANVNYNAEPQPRVPMHIFVTFPSLKRIRLVNMIRHTQISSGGHEPDPPRCIPAKRTGDCVKAPSEALCAHPGPGCGPRAGSSASPPAAGAPCTAAAGRGRPRG